MIILVGHKCSLIVYDLVFNQYRLLDLKHKFVDVPVLSVLVRAVVEDIPDAGGNSGEISLFIIVI